MKNLLILLSLVSVGLMAGLFFSWSVSVMTGLRKLPDREFLSSMQAMNRAIQNPLFFLFFFGAFILLLVDCFYLFEKGTSSFYLLIGSLLTYGVLVLGLTMFGNVPLNNRLDAFRINTASLESMKQLRDAFESRWNVYNNIRTVFNIISFILLIIAVLKYKTAR